MGIMEHKMEATSLGFSVSDPRFSFNCRSPTKRKTFEESSFQVVSGSEKVVIYGKVTAGGMGYADPR